MQKDMVFDEARRLYDRGFGILWLRECEKRPVESGWTKGPRKDWGELAKTYRKGFNVGVRLGNASVIHGKYLACIDVDIKSDDERTIKEALATTRLVTRGARCPAVLSGRGNGSRHYYFLSEKPFKQVTVRKEKDWEVVIYSDGRQVVLPPSIHPVSGKPYQWAREGEFPLLTLPRVEDSAVTLPGVKTERVIKEDFKVEKVDLSWLPVSEEVKRKIRTGEGVQDRSAYLMTAYIALRSAGLSQNETVSVLTDPDLFLGYTAYDHAHTNSRKKAAEWVINHTGHKVEEKFHESGDVEAFRYAPLPPIPESNWTDKLIRTAKGDNLKPCLMNSILIFENEFGVNLFHKDDFSLRRTYGRDAPWGGVKGRELNDEDLTAMRRYVGEKYGFELEEKHVTPTIISISARNHHHPVRDYLNGLKHDGRARVDTWLRDYCGVTDAPDSYLRAISRKVLCAMVARAYNPGAKFDYVLILEGPNQGEGKSRSIRALATPDWAGTVRFDMDHKDFVLALQGRWITEISELSGLGRKNTAFVKAIVSEESDRIRHPYGRFTETLPRQGIFIGTTNHFQYLEDETGNRRFWPVRVGKKIDVEGLAAIRDQLFAEAKIFYEKGEPLYLENPEIELEAREVQSIRMSEDSWEEKISKFFLEKKEKDFNFGQFKISDLFSPKGPLNSCMDSEVNLRRACRSLRRLDFKPKDIRNGKSHSNFWVKEE